MEADEPRRSECGSECGSVCETSGGVRSSFVLTADWLHAAAVTPWAADDRPKREPSTYVRGDSNQINSSRAHTPTVCAPGVAPAARTRFVWLTLYRTTGRMRADRVESGACRV